MQRCPCLAPGGGSAWLWKAAEPHITLSRQPCCTPNQPEGALEPSAQGQHSLLSSSHAAFCLGIAHLKHYRDTDVPNLEQSRQGIAYSPLSGRHGGPLAQELHLSLPPSQNVYHPGLRRHSVPTSWKPCRPHHSRTKPAAIPQLIMPNSLLAETAVCGPCTPCAWHQAIGWSIGSIMHLDGCCRAVRSKCAVRLLPQQLSVSLGLLLLVVASMHILPSEACAGVLTAMLRPRFLWQQDAGGLVAGSQLRHHAADLLLDMMHLHAILH